ncbi:unnamed protein product, partial [marine sediment metagenome]
MSVSLTLVYTIPFVVFGLFRYLNLMNDQKQGGNPTELLLTDKPLLATVALWVLTCIGLFMDRTISVYLWIAIVGTV